MTLEKAVLSFLAPCVGTAVLVKPVSRALAGLGLSQRVREEGPSPHLVKEGTPTGGGVSMFVMAAVTCALISDIRLQVALAVVLGFLIGLVDDILVGRHGSKGLAPRYKLLLQAGVATIYCLLAGKSLLYLPFGVVFFWAVVNSANLTDGNDGLLASVAVPMLLVLAVVSGMRAREDLAVLALATGGALFGFLWHNSHPASVFMGDNGSFFVGTVLAVLGTELKIEAMYLLLGAVFVAEAGSVILQVAYFKLTGGRRIFKMSPLHHHFELSGWSEAQIAARFGIASAVASLLSLLILLGRGMP